MVGICGWALYILALAAGAALARAGGLRRRPRRCSRVLAQRAEGVPLPRREWIGVGLAVVGLVFLVRLARRRLERQHERRLGGGRRLVRRLVRRRRRRDRAGRAVPRARRGLRHRRRRRCTRRPTSARRRPCTAGRSSPSAHPSGSATWLAFCADPARVPARAGARDRGPLVVLHERAADRGGRHDLPRDDAARPARRAALRRLRLRRPRRRRVARREEPPRGGRPRRREAPPAPSQVPPGADAPIDAIVTGCSQAESIGAARMRPGMSVRASTPPARVRRDRARGPRRTRPAGRRRRRVLAVVAAASGLRFSGSPGKLAAGTTDRRRRRGRAQPERRRRAARARAARASRTCPVTFVAGTHTLPDPPRASSASRPTGRRRSSRRRRRATAWSVIRGFRRLALRLFPADVTPKVHAYDAAVDYEIGLIAGKVDRPYKPARLVRQGPARSRSSPGQAGERLDRSAAREHRRRRARRARRAPSTVELPTAVAAAGR